MVSVYHPEVAQKQYNLYIDHSFLNFKLVNHSHSWHSDDCAGLERSPVFFFYGESESTNPAIENFGQNVEPENPLRGKNNVLDSLKVRVLSPIEISPICETDDIRHEMLLYSFSKSGAKINR